MLGQHLVLTEPLPVLPAEEMLLSKRILGGIFFLQVEFLEGGVMLALVWIVILFQCIYSVVAIPNL
ncbi:hypothetical protein D3C86_1817630 [compost metagenome]